MFIRHKGNFRNTERFLSRAQRMNFRAILQKYGDMGIVALATATPKDTGTTAASWDYTIDVRNSGYAINWFNTNERNGTVIAILIQYGHGTGTGGYVQGYDYINPAMRPIFDKMAEELWKEVSNL